MYDTPAELFKEVEWAFFDLHDLFILLLYLYVNFICLLCYVSKICLSQIDVTPILSKTTNWNITNFIWGDGVLKWNNRR